MLTKKYQAKRKSVDIVLKLNYKTQYIELK